MQVNTSSTAWLKGGSQGPTTRAQPAHCVKLTHLLDTVDTVEVRGTSSIGYRLHAACLVLLSGPRIALGTIGVHWCAAILVALMCSICMALVVRLCTCFWLRQVLLGTWSCCALDAVKCSQLHAFQGIIMQRRIALVLVHMDRAHCSGLSRTRRGTQSQLVGTLTAANGSVMLTAA